MPYYPEDQSDENIKKLRRTSVCAECGRQLYAYLDLETKQQYVACPTPGHEGIAREYKTQPTDFQSNIRREHELEQTHGREATTALAHIPKHGQLTQPQAEQILSLVYPGVPRDEIIRCAILCRDFGLHPLMKEVYIIPFGQGDKRTWATVLGINATRKLMAQRGTYSYIDDTPRLMTEEEQRRIFGEVDKENIVSITKLRTKDGLEAPGYGRWPKEKEPYGTDKGNTKANMSFIRSERNAFGRLSPDALPQGIEVIDEAYVEVPDVGNVNAETGEIVEGEADVVGDEEKPKSKAKLKAMDKSNDPLEPETKPEPKDRDETPITDEQIENLVKLMNETGMTYGDLAKFCNRDEERKWNIRDFKTELVKWQYDIIIGAFEKGKV